MPEGPLGFPRLTSLGPFVDEKSMEERLRELRFRSHSYRGYEPDEFIQLLESGATRDDLRNELRVIEAGRFHDMLEESYTFWVALDVDEKETFFDRNPDLVRWLEVYARVEGFRNPSEEVNV